MMLRTFCSKFLLQKEDCSTAAKNYLSLIIFFINIKEYEYFSIGEKGSVKRGIEMYYYKAFNQGWLKFNFDLCLKIGQTLIPDRHEKQNLQSEEKLFLSRWELS